MNEKKTSKPDTSVGIKILFGVLVGWAVLIAIGAVLGQKTNDVWKPLIIVSTMAVFLGVWAIALWSKRTK